MNLDLNLLLIDQSIKIYHWLNDITMTDDYDNNDWITDPIVNHHQGSWNHFHNVINVNLFVIL